MNKCYKIIVASRNSIKVDVKGGFYHVYNRGVAKQPIYLDEQDYKVFLNYLKEYLSPPPKLEDLKEKRYVKDTIFNGVPRQTKKYFKKIEMVSYTLMPNHFHFLIKQINKSEMKQFIQSLLIRYGMYFNKRHDRIGPLFQGRYKAVYVKNENYLLHLSRYIHLNPLEYSDNLISAYSSYANYIGLRNTSWVKSTTILTYFEKSLVPEIRKNNSYKNFVEKYKKDSKKILKDLTLD